MEDNRFFQSIWRFNGLLIAVVGALGFVVLLFVAYKLFQDVTRERTTRNIVNIEENAKVHEDWNFGTLSKIDNGKILMIPLYSDQSYDQAYYSKSSGSARNYLFINTENSQQKWLFDHTNYLIERSEKLKLGGYDSKEPILAILYLVVTSDSNGDGRLASDDLTTVAITKPDGSKYQELIKNMELFVDYTLLSQTDLFLIYQKDGVSYSATFDLDSRQLIQTSALPKIGS